MTDIYNTTRDGGGMMVSPFADDGSAHLVPINRNGATDRIILDPAAVVALRDRLNEIIDTAARRREVDTLNAHFPHAPEVQP